MPETLPPRRSFAWSFLAFALLAIAFGTVGYFFLRSRAQKLAPAAFLLPVDATSAARLGWRTRHIATPQTVLIGKDLEVAAGGHFLLLHLDGEVEALSGPQRIASPQVVPPSEVDFLRSPLRDVLTTLSLDSSAPAGQIRILSPFNMTRFLNPSITWQTRSDAKYDVAIRDPADEMIPARIARGIQPPIKVDQLQTPQTHELSPDRSYEVVVREAGSETKVGGARFLTSPTADLRTLPTAPAELVAEAVQALTQKPARTGDAWLALSKLPADWSNTELVVRLRLRLASELGLATEFAQAQQSARRLLRF